jgi:hypothetical protein
MKYLVTIDSDGIGDAAPSDGFVDPISVEEYRQMQTYTGAVEPTVLAGDSFYVRNIIVTSSGTTLAALIADINAKTKYHFVVASDVDDKLSLKMLPGYTRYIPSITEITEGVLVRYGFDNVVKSNFGTFPTPVQGIAKERGHVRWDLVLQSLQLTGNIEYQVIEVVDADSVTEPSIIAFYVDTSDTYYNFDMTGNTVYGKEAIKFAVAKALMFSTKKTRQVIDPISLGLVPEVFYHDNKVEEIIVGALTTTEQDALDAVTVDVV